MSDEQKFHGVDLGWMQAQWRDCRDKPEQLKIFRDMVGKSVPVQEILEAVGEPEYCGPMAAAKRSYHTWTAQEDTEIIRMVEEGRTDKEIADALGRQTHAVRKHIIYLRKKGVVVPYRIGKVTGSQEDAPEAVPAAYPDGGALPLELGELPGKDNLEAVGGTLRALLDEEEMLCERLKIIQGAINGYRARLSELLAMAGGGLSD